MKKTNLREMKRLIGGFKRWSAFCHPPGMGETNLGVVTQGRRASLLLSVAFPAPNPRRRRCPEMGARDAFVAAELAPFLSSPS